MERQIIVNHESEPKHSEHKGIHTRAAQITAIMIPSEEQQTTV